RRMRRLRVVSNRRPIDRADFPKEEARMCAEAREVKVRSTWPARLCAALLVMSPIVTWAQSPNASGRPADNPAAEIPAVPGTRSPGWMGQGRSEVLARHGIVATSDPLTVQAGLEILQQGGNASDAAI